MTIQALNPCFCTTVAPQSGGSMIFMVQFVHRNMTYRILGDLSSVLKAR